MSVKPCPRLALRCAGAVLAAWTAAACRPSSATTAPTPLAAGPVPWAEGDVLRAQPISGAGAAGHHVGPAGVDGHRVAGRGEQRL